MTHQGDDDEAAEEGTFLKSSKIICHFDIF